MQVNYSHSEGRKVAIKILCNLEENIAVIEEEYRIFKDLSRHDNFPTFYGAFLNKYDKEENDELWLVMEVSKFFGIRIPHSTTRTYFYGAMFGSVAKLGASGICCTI